MCKIPKKIVDSLLQAGLVLSFFVLFVAVVWQVISRYALNDPSTVTEEVSRFAVIWLSILGTAYAGGRMEHMAYDMLAQRLKGDAALWHMRSIAAVVLLFSLAVLVYGGGKLALRASEVGQLSATLEVPMGWVYACIPISGICLAFYQLCILIAPQDFRSVKEEDAAIQHVIEEIKK